MTAKKKASTGKKLKVKKETLKDLGVKSGAKGVKGGQIFISIYNTCNTCLCKSAGCYNG